MSGEKCRHVRVEEQELRRLREQESRLRSLQRDLPDRLNAIRAEAQRDLQQRLAPLEQRAQRQEQEAQKLKSNLASLELETHRRMLEQRKALQESLKASEKRQQDALQAEVQGLEIAMREGFDQQRRVFLGITAEQRQEYLSLNQGLDQKFTELMAEERQARQQLEMRLDREQSNKAQLAEDLLSDVETIWQQIEQNYQHERFTPGQLMALRRELDIANSNIKSGVTEAAIAVTQKTYLSLVDLRVELEQKEQEWLLSYNAALEELRSLIAEVQANRECEVEIGQGEEAQKFRLAVDHWTTGRLSRHEQELQAVETRLISEADTLTLSELKRLRDQIEDFQPQLGEIVEQARTEILSSQMRADIAERVAGVLGGMGYMLIQPSDSLYEGDDQRQAYVLKLRDLNGGEVVTIISPERDFGVNQISINSFGAILKDEQSQQQNAKAIFQALEADGLASTGEMRCNDNPRQDYADMEAVRQRSRQLSEAAPSPQASPQSEAAS
jgi:hypothetical protein